MKMFKASDIMKIPPDEDLIDSNETGDVVVVSIE